MHTYYYPSFGSIIFLFVSSLLCGLHICICMCVFFFAIRSLAGWLAVWFVSFSLPSFLLPLLLFWFFSLWFLVGFSIYIYIWISLPITFAQLVGWPFYYVWFLCPVSRYTQTHNIGLGSANAHVDKYTERYSICTIATMYFN